MFFVADTGVHVTEDLQQTVPAAAKDMLHLHLICSNGVQLYSQKQQPLLAHRQFTRIPVYTAAFKRATPTPWHHHTIKGISFP